MTFKKLFRSFGYFVLLILALIVIAGCVKQEVLDKEKGEEPQAQIEVEEPVETDEASIVPDEEVDETADWQVYRNEKYGFAMKYPQAWSASIFEKSNFYGGGAFPENTR